MEKLKKKKLSNKWLLSFLTIFMFIGIITFNIAYAASGSLTLTDISQSLKDFTCEYSGDSNWSTITDNNGNKSIQATLESKEGACNSINTQKSTITFTFNGKVDGNFTFNLSKDGNGNRSDPTNAIKEESGYVATLTANTQTKISIKATSEDDVEGTTTFIISNLNFTEKKDSFTVTLIPPSAEGYYIVNDQTVSSADDSYIFNEVTADEVFSLNVIINDTENFTFLGWYFNDKYYSSQQNIENLTFITDTRISVKFSNNSKAFFKNNDELFNDLDMAIASAENSSDKTIVLAKSGSIQGGESEETIKKYTLSSGLTLLIPSDNNNTMNKESLNIVTNYTGPTNFTCLYIDSFVEIICESNSSIYVSSSVSTNQSAGAVGAPTGAYGQIQFNDNTSKITLNNNSYLYAYGFISGDGTVVSKSGSVIKELFQIGDWRGGSITSLLVAGNKYIPIGSSGNPEKVFIINQYYIQNIECNLINEYGSTLNVTTCATVSGSEYAANTDFVGVSGSNSNGLFRLKQNAKLLKKYNGSNDRLYFELTQGDAEFSSINMDIMTLGIYSEKYVLPINSNITIVIKSGSSVDINQDLALLPGAELIIEEGATVRISNNVSIYCYDRDSWVGKGYTFDNTDIKPVKYSPSKKITRDSNSLINSKIDINGTIEIGSGSGIYLTRSTDDGSINKKVADIYSSNGTGKVIYNGTPGNSTTNGNVYTTYQFVQSTEDFPKINVSHLILRNNQDDDINTYSYINLGKNADSLTNKQYTYDNTNKIWKDQTAEITGNTITFINEQNPSQPQYEMTYVDGEPFIFPDNSNENTNFSYSNYTLKKWLIPEVGFFNPGERVTLSEGKDLTAYAIWGGWANLNGSYYYIDYNSGDFYTGLHKVLHYNSTDKNLYIMKFKDTGEFDSAFSGLFYNNKDNKTYYIVNGIVQENKGLIKYKENPLDEIYEYIYIQSDNSLLTSIDNYYIDTNLNNLLPSGYYSFDSNGYIKRDDLETANYDGQPYIKDYVTYIDGIKVSCGLFVYDSYYYYSNTNCEIVRSTTFYVSKTNNLGINEGLYYFDEEGRMCDQNFDFIEVGELI